MPDGLYERDILAWSQSQADLLRRLAAGERVNDTLDWSNVIEELEDVGRAELNSCRSFIRRALTNMLYIHAWPESQARRRWLEAVLNCLADAKSRFSPSMRQHIDLSERFEQAAHLVACDVDASGPPRPLPASCPFVLEDLLSPNPDVHALVARFASA